MATIFTLLSFFCRIASSVIASFITLVIRTTVKGSGCDSSSSAACGPCGSGLTKAGASSTLDHDACHYNNDSYGWPWSAAYMVNFIGRQFSDWVHFFLPIVDYMNGAD